MGKQVFVFLSLPGEAAEKEPGVGGGSGGADGVRQSKVRGREIRAGMCSLSRVHFGLQNHTTGCQCRLYRSQDVREEFPPFSKKKVLLHLIAASNKQFFQISSDLRSSEYVELKKH